MIRLAIAALILIAMAELMYGFWEVSAFNFNNPGQGAPY